jgi:hypothetical protein
MVISLGPWTTGFNGCIHSFLCAGGTSFDEPGGAFPLLFAQRPCLATCPLWAVGSCLSGSLPPSASWALTGRLDRGWMRISSLFERCPNKLWGGFGRLAVELALYVRALRPGANGRPPLLPPNLDTTRVVICTVSCLNGHLPLAERAAVRSDLGSGLALDRPTLSESTGEKVPETPKTCVLLVWMRSVDDWPLARIRTRFPGVSCGR